MVKTHESQHEKILKHERVVEEIRRRIREGEFPPGCRLPTETEWPALLGTGKQTVVRALNELVREGLIVRRRGDGTYVADRKHPPLIPGRHLRVGVLWHRSVLPERMGLWFQGAMMRGLLAAWGLEGVAPEWPRVDLREPTRAAWQSVERGLTVEALGESRWSRERHPAWETVQAGRYDGLVALSIIEEDWLDRILGLGVPTVLVDFPNERFASRADQVYVDAFPGYRAAVRHFIERGLTRIHFVGAYMVPAAPSGEMTPQEVVAYQKGKRRPDPDSFLRLSAFRAGMDEAGLQVPEPAVHFIMHGQERELAQQLLARPEAQRPQAAICHGANQARALFDVFAEHGLALQAAGGESSATHGPVHSIRIDGAELGRTAAELLAWRLQRPERPPLRVGVPMNFLSHAKLAPVALNTHAIDEGVQR